MLNDATGELREEQKRLPPDTCALATLQYPLHAVKPAGNIFMVTTFSEPSRVLRYLSLHLV